MSEPFYRDPEGQLPDLLLDDQAMFLETAHGTVVLLGYAHSDDINTLDHVQQLSAGKPVWVVIGGMHLGSVAQECIEWTVQKLRRFRPGVLVPTHCTGAKARAALWTAFPDACQPGGAGTMFDF